MKYRVKQIRNDVRGFSCGLGWGFGVPFVGWRCFLGLMCDPSSVLGVEKGGWGLAAADEFVELVCVAEAGEAFFDLGVGAEVGLYVLVEA